MKIGNSRKYRITNLNYLNTRKPNQTKLKMKLSHLILMCCMALVMSCKDDDFKVQEIRLQSFPENKPNGSEWDAISNIGTADVYFIITNNSGLNYSSSVEYERPYNVTTTWDVSDEDIFLEDLFEECVISLYDRDIFNSDDDYIGSITFILNSSTDNNKSTKTVEARNVS